MWTPDNWVWLHWIIHKLRSILMDFGWGAKPSDLYPFCLTSDQVSKYFKRSSKICMKIGHFLGIITPEDNKYLKGRKVCVYKFSRKQNFARINFRDWRFQLFRGNLFSRISRMKKFLCISRGEIFELHES